MSGSDSWLLPQTFEPLGSELSLGSSPRFAEWIGSITREGEVASRIIAAGWLPHESIQLTELGGAEVGIEAVHEILQRHFSSKWTEIATALLVSVDQWTIDQEAKATFGEALQAHGHGLFRVAPRLLFPEIERVCRLEFGLASSIQQVQIDRAIWRALGQLSPAELRPRGMLGFHIFKRLKSHLYRDSRLDSDIEALAADSLPSRHASLHGRVAYKSMQSSANAIVLTDFLFQALSALKSRNP